MKESIIILLMSLISYYGIAQNNANVWFFGNNAGLNFNNGNLQVLNNSAMTAEAGCASICDNNGNLLFYTNGNKVWNRNHNIMKNGDSLIGRPIVNQNSIIIPLPGSNDIYYLFTINNYDTIKGFNYSVIDITEDYGLGAVVQKNNNLKNNVIQKITAVEHCNGKYYWIIVHNTFRTFYSFLVTENGIDPYIESQVGLEVNADIGFMKISPDGSQLILPINNDTIMAQLFSFNNKTGKLSSPINIYSKNNQTYCFGTAFSSNSKVMYISTRGYKYQLLQYDISQNDTYLLNNTSFEITEGNNFGMQCAPDGKIYIACQNRNYLNLINYPDSIGLSCGFQEKALYFTLANSLMGMPNFPQSWFYKPKMTFKNTCFEDNTTFSFTKSSNVDSCKWSFYNHNNNEQLNFNGFDHKHIFENTGIYNVDVNYYHCGISNNVYDTLEIIAYPVSSLPDDTTIYTNESITLNAGYGYDTYLWNTGSTSPTIVVYDPGEYYVEINNMGCNITDTIFINFENPVLLLPNAFSPNGDGINDTFGPISPDNFMNYELNIINRNGTVVFSTNNSYHFWEGNYMGKQCPLGSYVWIITADYYFDGKIIPITKKGIVTLIR